MSEEQDQARGLYAGFEGYRTPSADDFRHVMTAGIVVPDANVLLNLYRYSADARDGLMSALESVGAQLWVPNQVLVEFWRNRETVIRDNPRYSQATIEQLEDFSKKAIERLRQWANRVSLPADGASSLSDAISAGFDKAIEGIDGFDAMESDIARDTAKDPILPQLEAILKDRAGAPFEKGDCSAAAAEALRRIQNNEPPGFQDKNKPNDQATGDFFVWEQTIRHAELHRCDVLFITADTKTDWWRFEAGEPRGPRPELVDEILTRTGQRLFMLRPAAFLGLAKQLLEVDISDESVATAAAVDDRISERDLRDGGWNADAVEELLMQMVWDSPVQTEVLMTAARQGGSVDRATVFEIGDFPETRQLKGFTRPILRIAQELRNRGGIHVDAVDLLQAYYEGRSGNPSLADGFRIPSVVAPLVAAVVERRFDERREQTGDL